MAGSLYSSLPSRYWILSTGHVRLLMSPEIQGGPVSPNDLLQFRVIVCPYFYPHSWRRQASTFSSMDFAIMSDVGLWCKEQQNLRTRHGSGLPKTIDREHLPCIEKLLFPNSCLTSAPCSFESAVSSRISCPLNSSTKEPSLFLAVFIIHPPRLPNWVYFDFRQERAHLSVFPLSSDWMKLYRTKCGCRRCRGLFLTSNSRQNSLLSVELRELPMHRVCTDCKW